MQGSISVGWLAFLGLLIFGLVDARPASAQITTNVYAWTGATSNTWNTATNWLLSGAPITTAPSTSPNNVVIGPATGQDIIVDFSQIPVTAPTTITVTAETVSGMIFGGSNASPANYTLTGGAITLNANANTAFVYVGAPTQTITLTTGLANIAGSSGPVGAAGAGYMKTGFGTLNVGTPINIPTAVYQGTLGTQSANGGSATQLVIGRQGALQLGGGGTFNLLAGGTAVLDEGLIFINQGTNSVATLGNTTLVGGTVASNSTAFTSNPLGAFGLSIASTLTAMGNKTSSMTAISGTKILVFAQGLTDVVMPNSAGVGLRITGVLASESGTTNDQINKAGQGILSFTAPNTYGTAGSLATVVKDGVLQLDFSFVGNSSTGATAPFGTATTPTTNILAPTVPIALSGGDLLLTGAAGKANSQTVSATTFQLGGSTFLLAPGTGGSMALSTGAWTRNAGAALLIDISTGSSTVTTTTAAPTGGVFGYAVVNDVNGYNFATGTTLAGYNAYTAIATPTSNDTGATTNYSLNGTTQLTVSPSYNVLKIAPTAAGQSYDLNTHTVTLTQGAILFTGANPYTITDSVGGGQLGAAAAEVIVQNYGTGGAAGALTVNVALGSGASQATFAGFGTTMITASQAARTGAMNIDGGIVQISNLNQLGSASAALNFGGGVAVNASTLAVSGGATLQWATGFSGNVTTGRTVSIFSTAIFDTNGNNVTLSVASGPLFTSGNVSNVSPNFSVENGTIVKTGLGNLTLASTSASGLSNALNGYTGTWIVQNGTLTLGYSMTGLSDWSSLGRYGFDNGGALSTQPVLVNGSGATLALGVSNTMAFGAAQSNLRNIYVQNGGTLSTADNTFNRLGNIWLQGGSITIGLSPGNGFGSIYLGTTANSLTPNGVGMNGDNATFSVVGNGTTTGTSFSQINGTGVINLGPNVAFDIDQTANPQSGTGADLVVNVPFTNQTVTQGTGISGDGFSGVGNAATGAFSKFGAGTMLLSAASTYSGTTAIYGGTLLVNNTTGSGTGTGLVNVYNTATLSGTGTISGPVTINGGGALRGNLTITGTTTINTGAVVAPGSTTTPGILTFGSNSINTALSFNGGSSYNFFIATTNPGNSFAFSDGSSSNLTPGSLTNNLLSLINGSTLSLNGTGATPATAVTFNVTVSNTTLGGTFNPSLFYSWTLATLQNPTIGGNPANIIFNTTTFSPNPAGLLTFTQNGNSLVLNYSPTTTIQTYVWTNSGGGSWESGGFWNPAGPPAVSPNTVAINPGIGAATDIIVDFTQVNVPSAGNTVTLTSGKTVSGIAFGASNASPGNWTLTGGAISFSANSTTPFFYVGPSTQTVTLNSGIAGSQAFIKTGAGTMFITSAFPMPTAVYQGTVTVVSASQSPGVQFVIGRQGTITSGGATGTFNIIDSNAGGPMMILGTILVNAGPSSTLAMGNTVLAGGLIESNSTAFYPTTGSFTWFIGSTVNVLGNKMSTITNIPNSGIDMEASGITYDVLPSSTATGIGVRISALMYNESGAGVSTLSKAGMGILSLTGPNIYGSTTTNSTIVKDGVLQLDFSFVGNASTATTPTTNILLANQQVALGGGVLLLTGAAGATNSQALGTMNFQPGGSTILTAPGSGGSMNLTTTTWNRAVGATLLVDISAGGSVTAPAAAMTNGLFGYAIAKDSNGLNFATVSGTTIAGFTGYTALTTPTDSSNNSTTNFSLSGGTQLTSALTPSYNALKITPTGQGQSYDINGNTVTLTTGAILFTGTNPYSIVDTVGGGQLASGLASPEVIVHNYATGALTINVPLGNGSSIVTFAGTGTTIITSDQSARSGAMNINGGIVQISSLIQLGSSSAPLNFGGGVAVNPSTLAVSGGATLQFAANYLANAPVGDLGNVTNGRTVTVFSTGIFDTNGNNITLSVGSGSLFTSGNVVAGTAAANGTLVKTGLGNLTLASPSSAYTGSWIVNNGTLTAGYALTSTGDSSSLGSIPLNSSNGNPITQSIAVNGSTSTLALGASGAISFGAVAPDLRNIYVTSGTLSTAAGTFNRLGNVWLQGGTISLGASAGSGFGSIYLGTTPNSASGVGVNGDNATFSVVGNGTVAGASFSQITGTGAVNLGPNVAFDVDQTATPQAVTGADLVVSAVLTNQTASQGAGVSGDGFSGTGNAAIGSFSKFGAGTMLLTAANTYSGTTSVFGGTLLVNNTTGSGTGYGAVNIFSTGSVSGTGSIVGPVTIYGGGTLKGTLTVTGTTVVTSGGLVSPGNSSPGTLTFGSTLVGTSLTFNAGGGYNFFIATTNAGSTTAIADGSSSATQSSTTGNNLLVSAGSGSSLNLNGTGTTAATAVTINVISGADNTLGAHWDPSKNYSWQMATFAGALTGNPAGIAINASAFTAQGFINGITGNFTIAVTASAIELDYVSNGGLTSAFWNGLTGNGLWNSTNGTTSNWQGSYNGGVAAGQPLVPPQGVVYNFAGIGTLPVTTLGQSFSIFGLVVAATNTTQLTIANDSNTLTIGTGGISVANGAGAVTIATPIALNGDQTWANASTTNALTIAGPVGGSGNLTTSGNVTISSTGALGAGVITLSTSGPGTLTLMGSNTFTGATTINNGGIINYQNNAAFGATSPITVASGGTAQVQNNTVGGNLALTISGTGAAGTTGAFESVSGANGYAGPLTLGANATIASDLNSTLSLTGTNVTGAGFKLTLAGAGNGSISNVIATGAGALTMNGTGIWTLLGANTYTGVTTLSAGILNVGVAEGAGGPLGIGGSIVFSGGTLQYSANNQFDYSSRFSTAAGQLYRVDTNKQSVIWASALTSSGGSLTKLSLGTLFLTGNNTYSGGTTIVNGTLNVSSDNALGAAAGVVNMNGGTLQFALSGGVALNLSRNVILNGGAFDTNGGNDIVNGVISGASPTNSNLIKNGAGVLTVTNTNTYAGSTTVNAGILYVPSGSLGTGPLNVNNTNASAPGTVGGLYLYNGAQTVGPLSGTIADAGDGNLAVIYLGGPTNATSLTVNQTAPGTFPGILYGSGNLIVSSSSNSTLQLSGNSTYAGSTTINGGTVQLNVTNALPTSTALTLGAAGTLNLNNFYQTVFSLSGAGSINTGSGAGGILTVKNNNDLTFVYSGVMSGTGGLNVNLTAGSIQQLTGANSYTGPTNINGGTLQMGANGVLSNGATATVLTTANTAGATFDLNNFNVTTGPIQGGGVLGGGILLGLGTGATGSGGTLTIKLPFTSTFAGNITGNGNLILSGSGTTLILTGNNNINGSISADSYVAGNVGTNAQVFVPLGTGNGLDMKMGSQQIASLTGGDSSGNNLQFTGNGVIDSSNVAPTLTVAVTNSYPSSFNFGGGIFNDVSLTLDSSFSNLSQVMTMSGNSPTTGNFKVGNFNATSSAISTLIVTGKLGDDGTNGGAGSLTVGNGGIVAGTGTIHTSITVQSGGTLRGGFTDGTSNNTGTLTINVTNPSNNNVTLSQGSILQTEVSRISTGNANASMISVTAGSFNLNPTTNGTFAISLLNSGLNDAALVGGETYTINLAQMSGSGSIQLNGSPMARGFIVPATDYTVNSPTLLISNSSLALDSTGAYLQLTFTAVPEPEHIMLLCVGVLLTGLAVRRRWRERSAASVV